MKNVNVNCRNCMHYYVTWDLAAPHGCRAIGFKSKLMPHMEVLKNSGLQCQKFTPKNK